MPSAAEQLAERFQREGWAYITDMVQRGATESLHLDFKEKTDPSTAALGKEDRKNLGKALSGFANAEGGLIVWGVKTSKQGEGYDQASRVVALRDLRGFVANLTELTPELVSPPIAGLRHLAIEDPDMPNTGIVVTVVPESDRTPHMGRGPDQQKYFRRSGSSFRAMEHYEVADLFGRRAHPVLTATTPLTARLSSSGANAVAEFTVRFILHNIGRGLARFPCLTIGKPSGWNPTKWPGHIDPTGVIPAPQGWWKRVVAGGDTVIYPGDEINFAKVSFQASNHTTHFPDLTILYRVLAAEAEPYEGVVQISSSEIRHSVANALTGYPIYFDLDDR